MISRSRKELAEGDHTLAILISAIAIEAFLSRMFLKLKKIENLKNLLGMPTSAQIAAWEKQYKRNIGFSTCVDFVSKKLTGVDFDTFIDDRKHSSEIIARAVLVLAGPPTKTIQKELFERRNRIAHWGFVDSAQNDAERSFNVAVATLDILREMDREKYKTL